MKKIFLFILDLFFPNRCPVCDKFIDYDKLICADCEKLMEESLVSDKVCDICGKEECLCKIGINWSRTAAVYYYEKTPRNGVLSLKDGGRQFGVFLGRKLAEKIMEDKTMSKADHIAAVPMDKTKKRLRGYNQAEVIAKEISAVTGIPYIENALFKKPSAEQHSMKSAADRKKNTDSFYRGSADVNGKKIIICDDVITTGSTINKCARLLRDMNAADVYAAVGTTTKLKGE